MKIVCVHLRVSGRVQGVFFRASMNDVAVANGVVGWVENNPDGSVEALLQGREESVKAVQNWARNGPPGARVDSVEVKDVSPDRSLRDFKIIR
ncbi:MAG: acylphosphatase [Thaumarchaeota archaeon]|nr:acylphosphatase [Nitrososphaerota archaeon]MBI3023514.1 acylphosphatase [Nitrososphaerota archaeon]